MRIIKYSYQDSPPENWKLNQIEFTHLNLFVGESSSGKTRTLNTLFNLGSFVARNKVKTGKWSIEVQCSEDVYEWKIRVEKKRVVYEKLVRKINGSDEILVERDEDKFIFCGSNLPKLSSDVTSISLLKDELAIKPIFDGFATIMRRNFFSGDLEKCCEYISFSQRKLSSYRNLDDVSGLYGQELKLSIILYIIQEMFPNDFKKLIEHYINAFPFISECRVQNLDRLGEDEISENIPVFSIREQGVDRWTHLQELSSGMQKVLLLMVDIYTLKDDSIYMIDEYENSLGISAINFFPSFLHEYERNSQFIITSHHPYLINNFPVENWIVFHRKANVVDVKYGSELVDRLGRSKQSAFVKLTNDSFYLEGIE